MKNRLYVLALTAALTGCAGAPAATGTITAPAAVTVTETAIPAAEEPTAANVSAAARTSLSLDDAKDVFSETHPDIPIEVAKLEGDVYYIQGYEGSKIYKMKIGVDSGTIYLDKVITTGRRR